MLILRGTLLLAVYCATVVSARKRESGHRGQPRTFGNPSAGGGDRPYPSYEESFDQPEPSSSYQDFDGEGGEQPEYGEDAGVEKSKELIEEALNILEGND